MTSGCTHTVSGKKVVYKQVDEKEFNEVYKQLGQVRRLAFLSHLNETTLTLRPLKMTRPLPCSTTCSRLSRPPAVRRLLGRDMLGDVARLADAFASSLPPYPSPLTTQTTVYGPKSITDSQAKAGVKARTFAEIAENWEGPLVA